MSSKAKIIGVIALSAILGIAAFLGTNFYHRQQLNAAEDAIVAKLQQDKNKLKQITLTEKTGKIHFLIPKEKSSFKLTDALTKPAVAAFTKNTKGQHNLGYVTFKIDDSAAKITKITPTLTIYHNGSLTVQQKKSLQLTSVILNKSDLSPVSFRQFVAEPVDESLRALNWQVILALTTNKNLPADKVQAIMATDFLQNIEFSNYSYQSDGLHLKLATPATKETTVILPPEVATPYLTQDLTHTTVPARDFNEKVVSLTFDDGPNPETTPKILDILAQNNVKVTFFMVGTGTAAHPELVKQVAAAGHLVAQHSFDHPQLTTLTGDQIKDQISRTNLSIYAATGQLPSLIRPPYGAVNQTVAQNMALPAIQWSVDSDDWKIKDPTALTNRVLAAAFPEAIILMHDTHEQSVAALDGIIKGLKSQGYSIVPVTEMLPRQLLPGYQYFGGNDERPM